MTSKKLIRTLNMKNNLQSTTRVYNYKKKTMANLTNDEKGTLYNDMLFRYQRMSEEIRQIRAKSFEVSSQDQEKINLIESRMKQLYSDTQRLFQ